MGWGIGISPAIGFTLPNPKGIAPSSPRLRRAAGLYLGIDVTKFVATSKRLRHTTRMPQALSAVYIHVVFSTKERRPFLRNAQMRHSLYEYLGGVTKTLECPPIIIGGVEDHVHLLCCFGRTITQAEWIKELKRVSNAWIKCQGRAYEDFAWQGGYADFSVSQSNLEKVEAYIAGQDEHHRTMSFQDEVRAMLRRHKLEFDERYLWD